MRGVVRARLDRGERPVVGGGIPIAGDEREVSGQHLARDLDRGCRASRAIVASIGGAPISASASFCIATLAMTERALAAARVLVIDELGYLPMDATSAHWIFQIVSRRYERGSIVLTSNRGFGDWGAVFADQVVASAILDRLLHHATVVNVKGQSFRMRAHVPSPGSAREGAAMLG